MTDLSWLSSKQRGLLKIAREYGYVTIADARFMYSTDRARRIALRRLVDAGFLRPSTVPNRFDLVRIDGGTK